MPIHKSWDSWIHERCFDLHMIYVVALVINAVSDFSILILPQYVIWNLQMPRKRKIAISGAFLPAVL